MKDLIDEFIKMSIEEAKAKSPRAGMIKDCVTKLKGEFKKRLYQEEGYTKEGLSSALESIAILIEEANKAYEEASDVVVDEFFYKIEKWRWSSKIASKAFAFLYGEIITKFGPRAGKMILFGYEIEMMLNALHEALKELHDGLPSEPADKKKEEPNNITDNIDNHNEEREKAFKAILEEMTTYLSDLYLVQKLPVEGLDDMLEICVWPAIVACTKLPQKFFSQYELFQIIVSMKIIGLEKYPPEKVDILMEYLKTGVLYVCTKMANTGLELTYRDCEIVRIAVSLEVALQRIIERQNLPDYNIN